MRRRHEDREGALPLELPWPCDAVRGNDQKPRTQHRPSMIAEVQRLRGVLEDMPLQSMRNS